MNQKNYISPIANVLFLENKNLLLSSPDDPTIPDIPVEDGGDF